MRALVRYLAPRRAPRSNPSDRPDPIVELYRYLRTAIDPWRLEHLLEPYYDIREVPPRLRRASVDEMDDEEVGLFASWLSAGAPSDLPEAGGELGPAYLYLRDPTLLPGDTWLAHFTKPASLRTILRDGMEGESDMDSLPFTRGRTHHDGWAYAYAPLLDVDEGNDGYDDAARGSIGPAALVFQAPCVRVEHTWDEEPQVIFWAPSARSGVPVVRIYGEGWSVKDRVSGRVLCHGDFDSVVAWISDHVRQYGQRILHQVGRAPG